LPLLQTQVVGPTASGAKLCQAGIMTLRYNLTAPVHGIEIGQQRFEIESTDGGLVVGSNGTKYFTNIKVLDGPVTVMGPIDPPSGSPPISTFSFDLFDSFTIGAQLERELTFTVDVACSEDSPGELSTHTYRVHWLPMKKGDAKDLVTMAQLDTTDISPDTEMIGASFTVTQ
jgi:hypothetical protein